MHLHIKMEAHGRGKIFIDGEEIQGVKALTLKLGVGDANEACLSFLPDEITYEGIADVTSLRDESVKLDKVSG